MSSVRENQLVYSGQTVAESNLWLVININYVEIPSITSDGPSLVLGVHKSRLLDWENPKINYEYESMYKKWVIIFVRILI